MRKLAALILTIAMAVQLAACAAAPEKTASPQAENTEASQEGTEKAAKSTENRPVFQIAYENNPGEPLDIGVNKWRELAEEEGKVEIQAFPSSQLGSKSDIIDQMQAGEPLVTGADVAFLADRGASDLGILFGPFLFKNDDELRNAYHSDWFNEASKKVEEIGLKILSVDWQYGDRQLLVNKNVADLKDLKGLKVRVPNNTIQIKGMEQMGVVPTPMALGDTYTALQQGTIDGLENPLPVLYNGKYQEVAKTLILTNHVRCINTWVCSLDYFNSLTPEQQESLINTCNEAAKTNNAELEKSNADVLQKFKDEGVTVIDLSDDQVQELQDTCAKFYELPDFTSIWSEGLYDTVKEAMK